MRGRIGVHDGPAVHVGNGGVGDGGRVADDGLQQRVQPGIGLQGFVQHRLDLLGIVGIDKGAAEVDLRGFARALADLLGHESGIVISLGRTLPHQMRDVQIGKHRHQREHHAADGEHQLCFQADLSHRDTRIARDVAGIISAASGTAERSTACRLARQTS